MVEHDGQEGRRRPLRRARRSAHPRCSTVAMVFQQFALLPWRTVRENVGFGLELRGMRQGRARTASSTRSSTWSASSSGPSKYAHELSGGMQQRVGLARAFATDADILLMDEPFSALDPLIRDKLQDELLELQKRAQQDHRLRQPRPRRGAEDRQPIAIMEGGRIVQCGDAPRTSSYARPTTTSPNSSAHEPAQRAPRHLGDDARLDAPPRGRRHPHRRRAACASTSTPTTTRCGATLDGREARIATADGILGDDPADQCDMIVAPVDLTLRAGDRAEAPDRPPDRAGRPARPPRRPLRRRRNLPRPAEAAMMGLTLPSLPKAGETTNCIPAKAGTQ